MALCLFCSLTCHLCHCSSLFAAAVGVQGGSQLELTPAAVLTRTGLAAGTTFVAASITYPLDIIRKRLIIQLGDAGWCGLVIL